MLNTETLLSKMLEHFPKWMDIRKRAKTSVGGQLLESVAEETATLKQTLEDFKKDFFIDAYFGKEDKIVDFVYKIQVGEINVSDIKILSKELSFTDDLNVFYEQLGYFYYEDGYLFFRMEDIDTDKISYQTNDFIFTEVPEKMHVWNIFDEFATFVGIERHENESNKQLEKRILNVFQDKVNNSKEGLAHAIFTELMVLDPELKVEEIKVEGVTPENLRKKYDEFSTVLDKLSSINKDCYKYKRWDVDPWFYSVRSIDYIPHAWDVALEAFKDGVGKAGDLKVLLSDTNDTTDATISLYKKSEVELYKYLKEKKLETDVELQLTQFNEELKPIQAKYKMTASKAIDISTLDIGFQYSDISHVQSNYDLYSLVKKDDDGEMVMKNITISDFSLLPDTTKFKLKFYPYDIYKKLTINQCSLSTQSGIQSLLKENKDFILENGQLVYKHCKKFVNKINDFYEITNLEDTSNGLAVQTSEIEATGVIDLSGVASERIYCEYGCDFAPIEKSKITFSNFEMVGDRYVSYYATGDTKLEIDMQANSFSFTTNGDCIISIYQDGELMTEPFKHTNIMTYSTPAFKGISRFTIKILSLNNLNAMEVYDLKYTHYEVKETLAKGDFYYDETGAILPDMENNQLTITLKTYFEKSPYIKYVYIGANYDLSLSYETEVFTTEGISNIYISKDYLVADLILVGADGVPDPNHPLSKKNFNPHLSFQSTDSAAYIELDLSKFIKINKITTDKGIVKAVFKDSQLSYIINLNSGDALSKVFIDGITTSGTHLDRLIDLFDVNLISNDKLYVTNLYDGFIVEKNGIQTQHRLCDIEIIKNVFKYGSFKFTNLPSEYNQHYIRNFDNNVVIVSNNGYNGSIKNAVIKTKDKQTYIAYNEHKMIQQKKTMLQIEDTFKPFIPKQDLFYYEIENMTPDIEVQFHTFDEDYYEIHYTNQNWTVGKKYICLKANDTINDGSHFLSHTLTLNKKFPLQRTSPISNIMTLDNGTDIDLCQYLIATPAGIRVNYLSINPNIVSMEQSPEYYSAEKMFKHADGYNKLNYCNVDQIIDFEIMDTAGSSFRVTSDMYKLLPEEGIIVWDESAPSILDYNEIYIRYTIKIPNTLIFNDDLLYKKTNSPIDGFTFLKRIDNLTQLKNGDFIDLSKDSAFKESDRAIVNCTNPNFDGFLEEKGITFKRTIQDQALFAKSGYYYIDGLEYYLFSQETSQITDKIINVEFSNTSKDEEGIHLQKTSHNYINNSLLNMETIGNVYSKNFTKDSTLRGASSLNAITACSSFNHWKSVGSQLSLVNGYNGVGIYIQPFINDGYAYVSITDSLFEETRLSLYRSGILKAYIGKEKRYGDLKYPNAEAIEIVSEITPTVSNYNILSCSFVPDANCDYYLIIKGTGIVDDIIVCKDGDFNGWDYHKKNITTLGLSVNEQIIEDFVNRLFFYNTKGYKNLGAEIDENNKIINSSLINWGLTNIKEYSAYDDWRYCEMNNLNIENNLVVSKSQAGEVMTDPIFIGDRNMIKSITVKVNDVAFDQTSGFIISIYSSDNFYGIYEMKTSFKENIGIINEDTMKALGKYIKIKIAMPPKKVVNSLTLFAEYKESDEATPMERVNSNGELLSEIYDGQYQAKYKLTDINIDSISNINDIEISIRASRENKDENIWTDWKKVTLNENLNVANNIVFENYRFFQLRIKLKRIDSYVKINYFDMKVVR